MTVTRTVTRPKAERHSGANRAGRRAALYNANAAQVGEEFGVSEKTVRRWTAAGLITGRRIGPRLIRYDLDEVRRDLGV